MQFFSKRILLLLPLLTALCCSTSFAGTTKFPPSVNGVKPSCYLYGYADNLITAEIINATIEEVAYSGFEDNTTGNWSFSNLGIQTTAAKRSLTGNKFYGLSSGSITKSFSVAPAKNFVVSYWSRTGAQTVNGGVTAQAGRSVVVDGISWTYYEHLILSPVSITVSGTGIIDELRLYPEDATMTTYAYEPFIGVSAKCDVNNNVIYYEYDLFNRISVVRDQDYNISKRFCYGDAGQQEDCSGTLYFSAAKNGQYTRNDCGAGFAGSTLTYSVPIGTYTSNASQTVADQLAQNDVNLNGQTYANINGTCSLLYYNIATSGTYTRNNCPAGYQGTAVTYTVPAGTYNSAISQADANQKAQNDVTANGQNYANTNGACGLPCGFTSATNFTIVTSGISSSGSTVTFYIVFRFTGTSISWFSSNQIATISGCRPSVIRTISISEGGRIWSVDIYPTGQFYARLVSGVAPTAGATIGFSGGSYNL